MRPRYYRQRQQNAQLFQLPTLATLVRDNIIMEDVFALRYVPTYPG